MKLTRQIESEYDADILRHRKHFHLLRNYAPQNIQILCVGARTGAEVVAARQEGFMAAGANVVRNMDVLGSNGNQYHAVYWNCTGELWNFGAMASDIMRALMPPGWLMVSIKLDMVNEFLACFHAFRVLYQQSNNKPGSSERILLIMRIK